MQEDINYIKYGIEQLKDSYELYNNDWAKRLLNRMKKSIDNIETKIKDKIGG